MRNKKRLFFLASISIAFVLTAVAYSATPAAAYDLWACPGASGVKIYTDRNQSPSYNAETLCHLNPLEQSGDYTHSDNHIGTNNIFASPYDIISSHMNNNAESFKILDRSDGCDTVVKFYDKKKGWANGGTMWKIRVSDESYDWVHKGNFPSQVKNNITSIQIKKDC